MSTDDVKPNLSKNFIDYHAIGMVRALQSNGHTAYLVGGCVRDLLVGMMPKDFDIGTSANPQQVKRLISFAFIIGRRFRLVLVKRDDKQYEVATFRREPRPDEFPEGVPFGDNIFGTPEEDAKRRDFTCNALFYDPMAEEIIDFVDGKKDIEAHMIRMIGDPERRLVEDPIRILRALRFAHKLHFRIEPQLRGKMQEFSSSLNSAVLPRRREEYLKLLRLEDPALTFREGFDLDMWKTCLPHLNTVYEKDETIGLLDERLSRIGSRLIDTSDTSLLFGTLVLGWLRAKGHVKGESINFPNLESYEPLTKFCKLELGMHNWEYAKITRSLELQKTLDDPKSFVKKGSRRKFGALLGEAFPLALDLAHIDGILDPDTLDFWDAELDIALAEIRTAPPRKKPTKHFHKKRPKRKSR